MQTTIIYFTGVYDTLDLFTQELKMPLNPWDMLPLPMMPVSKR